MTDKELYEVFEEHFKPVDFFKLAEAIAADPISAFVGANYPDVDGINYEPEYHWIYAFLQWFSNKYVEHIEDHVDAKDMINDGIEDLTKALDSFKKLL